MYATRFTYDGIPSEQYDLIICSFDGSDDGSATAGSKIDFTYSKAPNSYKWVKTSAIYNEQLSFQFSICKDTCSTDKYEFSEREIVFIERWLNQKSFKWLQFDQEGYENIWYNAVISLEKRNFGGKCVGFDCTVTCDAPFGWSDEQSLIIDNDTSITNIDLYDISDEVGEVPVEMQITSNTNGTIKISNELTKTHTVINNCLHNEVIYLSDNMVASSSECELSQTGLGYVGNHKSFNDDFNWEFFKIGNTFDNRINKIKVEGSCVVRMSWRVPRKAVV